jgi:hypothetical protein
MSEQDIIDRLGGSSEVARLCEVTVGAVSQWRHNGIPRARLMFLQAIRPEAFGLASRAKKKARRAGTKEPAHA